MLLEHSLNKTPISTRKNETPYGCLMLFGLPFAAAGFFLMWIGCISPLLQQFSSNDWVQVPCTILKSEIEEHRDSEGDKTFSNEISFRYDFEGQQHFGERVDFGSISPKRKRCLEIQNQFPAGKLTDCFVDPENPSKSVLLRESGFSIWMFLFSSIFAGIGLSVSIGAFIAYRRSKAASTMEPGLYSAGSSGLAVSSATSNKSNKSNTSNGSDGKLLSKADAEDRRMNVPQRLKPESSVVIRFFVVLGICLFWNGIVSVFVYQLLTNQFSIFFALFMAPFILVGIALLLGMIYSFLAMFNPKTELALSSGTVPLGGEADLAWEILGRTSGIRRLTIELIGTESATYTRGTDTHTDTDDFFKQTIVDSENAEEFAFGSTVLQIPAETMHTFEATCNKVIWSLQVKADIPWWPDVNEKFPFRVSPAPVE
jgi:hypothetical protein